MSGNAGTFHFLFDFLFRYVRLCLVAVVVNHFGLKFKLATKGKAITTGKGKGKQPKKMKGATADGVSFISTKHPLGY
jgi:hypothetical protein